MYIVCINNGVIYGYANQHGRLTNGKKYQVFEYNEGGDTYKIMDDNGEKYWYSVTRFISLQEYRKRKLNKICL